MSVDSRAIDDALRFVRPRLRGHAGDMSVDVDDEGVATVHFYAACESCPAMAVTFAGLVQTALEAVPGISRVTAPQVHASPQVLASIRRRLGVKSATVSVPLGIPATRAS